MNELFEQVTRVWEIFRNAALVYLVAGFVFGLIVIGAAC